VPRPSRDGDTDLLDLWFSRPGFYARIAPNLLTSSKPRARRVVDPGSGRGGGALQMRRNARAAGNQAKVVL